MRHAVSPVSDLNNLYFFAKVVECGSYTAAAEALGLQTSKLSRRIGALEAELGVRLLNRTTRKLSLTEAGRTFHRHCVALIAEAQAAKDSITQTLASPRGLVRVSCPTGLLQSGVAEMLSRYLEAWPQVQLALDATNRRVDVVEEGVDIAIRVRVPPLKDSDLAMRTLCPTGMVLVASPSLVRALGEPQSPDDIGRMPTVSMTSAGDRHVWQFRNAAGRLSELAHEPRLKTDDLYTLRQAALIGVGIAFLPEMLISQDIADGGLVRLLPDWGGPDGIVHAVFPSRRGMVPAIRELLDFLVVCFSEQQPSQST
ncbi:LysR family transcriptional regulator [Cupriavidus basilensis OR16]|uniref:LysR family transcriptional regulator n=1 Tax=Cupriavidus basilensis OR16 TaxID=1127483 RepID=H1S7H3_9BURK|nr:LysR family transcriptional regulator [Cupriavidus basilensis OR16]